MMDKSHEFFGLQDDDAQVMGYALVGRFFSMWGVLEVMMNDVIGGAMKLDITQMSIITANLGVTEKIHMIRTFITESALPDAEKMTYGNLLKMIIKLSQTRNIYAHCCFMCADDRSSVAFARVKAKGKLEHGFLVVTVQEFDEHDRLMADYSDQLGELGQRLRR